MKKAIGFLVSSLLLCVSFIGIVSTAQAQDPQQLWALIICGSTGGSFSNNAQYMYHVLHDHYSFAGIRYLSVDTSLQGVNALSTRTNTRSAITSWLHDRSNGNDIAFIYFTSHGGGYHTIEGLESGRVETVASDEGSEQRESTFRISFYPLNTRIDWDDDGFADDRLRDFNSDRYIEVDINDDGTIDRWYPQTWDIDGDGREDDIFIDSDQDNLCDLAIDADTNGDRTPDNFTSDYEDTNNDGRFVGIDLNQDGDQNDWVGVDECLQVQDGWYWDDELASDLNTVTYAKLIFVRQGCIEGNKTCFGGGLIDDISASKRIIMTATNETWYSYGDMDNPGQPGYGYSEWSEAFIDALHGQRTHYDGAVIHDPVFVNADWSNDGHVSMWEAWDYAWRNDPARLSGDETPWLDDNFNRLPTYQNEADQLDLYDGLFSMETYFGFDNLKSPDVNDDGIDDILDIATIANAYGSYPGHPKWNSAADLNNDNKVDIRDVATAAKHYGKYYSDPSSPVSTKTILFTYPIRTIVSQGETFSVKVILSNVDNLRGWEFKLYWNNTILKCTGAEISVPDVWNGNVVDAGPGIENNFNATYGRYWIAVSALNPAPPFNGSTVVATLTFEARAAGSTMLDLQETKLAHDELYAIPHIAIDGSVKVRKR